MNNRDIKEILSNNPDEIERFSAVRSYLDNLQPYGESENLVALSKDPSELIRSELADFLIITGGMSGNEIMSFLEAENDILVYPKLWLALSIKDKFKAKPILDGIEEIRLSFFEKSYYYASMYVTCNRPFFLYSLCSVAFSDDIPTCYTSIDLLEIVAGSRKQLLNEITFDLRMAGVETAVKASEVFGHTVDSAKE